MVIPKDVRKSLRLKPGQKLQVLPFNGRMELIPLESIEAARGFLRGIDTTVPRDAPSEGHGRATRDLDLR
ncbi:AbrB/MazE/SpoVT family DNA-binding domain-containing protein [Candidatus Palauibacter sp.]|uniref:AbrB/MazE/SpoVT family DNA-binding domain-containing protein n=1 Tax=Candidatus Palauibacter sp. TaxID=3101350 RepID=UPI003B5C0EF0